MFCLSTFQKIISFFLSFDKTQMHTYYYKKTAHSMFFHISWAIFPYIPTFYKLLFIFTCARAVFLPHCEQRLPIIAIRAEQSLSMCSRGKYLRLSGRDLFSIEVQAVSLLILDYGLLNIVGPTVGLDDIAESLRKIMSFYRWLILYSVFFSQNSIYFLLFICKSICCISCLACKTIFVYNCFI